MHSDQLTGTHLNLAGDSIGARGDYPDSIKTSVGCFKRLLIYKVCSNQLMSTSTKQEKKVEVFSRQNWRVI
jgi:hypothetical protein